MAAAKKPPAKDGGKILGLPPVAAIALAAGVAFLGYLLWSEIHGKSSPSSSTPTGAAPVTKVTVHGHWRRAKGKS